MARRVKPKGLKAIRVLIFAGLAVLFMIATQMVGGSMVAVAILIGLFAATLAAVNLIGPWLVQRLGRTLARTARGPARLLAARRLAEDPKAAWRTVSGVAIAGFVAGSVALFPMLVADTGTQAAESIAAMVPEADAEALAATLAADLGDRADVAVVDSSGFLTADPGTAVLEATTSGDDLEAVRSTMTAILPGDPPEREIDSSLMSNRIVSSVRTGVTVVLAVVFITAAVSTAISAIGSVLDRRRTYRLLHLAGTPNKSSTRPAAKRPSSRSPSSAAHRSSPACS
nr:hypothetical protein GCM10025732_12070 [Glycomyces mayteni]